MVILLSQLLLDSLNKAVGSLLMEFRHPAPTARLPHHRFIRDILRVHPRAKVTDILIRLRTPLCFFENMMTLMAFAVSILRGKFSTLQAVSISLPQYHLRPWRVACTIRYRKSMWLFGSNSVL